MQNLVTFECNLFDVSNTEEVSSWISSANTDGYGMFEASDSLTTVKFNFTTKTLPSPENIYLDSAVAAWTFSDTLTDEIGGYTFVCRYGKENISSESLYVGNNVWATPFTMWNGDFSVAFYIKFWSVSTTGTILQSRLTTGYGLSIFMSVSSVGELRFDYGGYQWTVAAGLTTDTLYHIAFTVDWDNGVLCCYKDGVLFDTITVTLTEQSFSNYLWMGASGTTSEYPTSSSNNTLVAYISNLSIYDSTLTEEQVTSLYGTKLTYPAPNFSNVIDMTAVFCGCSSLSSVDTDTWDIHNVLSLYWIFRDCSSLTKLDVSNWDTSSLIYPRGTFWGCKNLTELDVSNWNMSNCTQLHRTFCNCESLPIIDVSKWDISKVKSLEITFAYCYALTSLDLSSWDTSKVTTIWMFVYKCTALETIKCPEEGLDFSLVTTTTDAFTSCTALTSVYLSNLGVGINLSYSPLDTDSVLWLLEHVQEVEDETITLNAEQDYDSNDDIVSAIAAVTEKGRTIAYSS